MRGNAFMNVRYDQPQSPMYSRVTPISHTPNGADAGMVEYTEGYTSMYRIIHMPTRLATANRNSVGLNTFAARESSPKNGTTKTRTVDHTVIHTQGGLRRRCMKNVSSPRLPYQITRY